MVNVSYFLSHTIKNSDVIYLYRTLSRAKFTTVCQPEFFLSPLRTQFCHEKPLHLLYRIFSTLSNFLIIVFFWAVFMTPVCNFQNRTHVALFKVYDILTGCIKQLTLGPNCPPGVLPWDLGLYNIFGCCLVNYCGGLIR